MKSPPARFKRFGKYYISLPSLNKNKIYIITGSNETAKYKKELISNELKHIIKQILNDNFDIEDEVDLLFDNERVVLRDILDLCDIANIFDLNKDTAKAKLISKFNIMKNEILSGNTSKELLDEFSSLLDELLIKALLSRPEYNKLKKILI